MTTQQFNVNNVSHQLHHEGFTYQPTPSDDTPPPNDNIGKYFFNSEKFPIASTLVLIIIGLVLILIIMLIIRNSLKRRRQRYRFCNKVQIVKDNDAQPSHNVTKTSANMEDNDVQPSNNVTETSVNNVSCVQSRKTSSMEDNDVQPLNNVTETLINNVSCEQSGKKRAMNEFLEDYLKKHGHEHISPIPSAASSEISLANDEAIGYRYISPRNKETNGGSLSPFPSISGRNIYSSSPKEISSNESSYDDATKTSEFLDKILKEADRDLLSPFPSFSNENEQQSSLKGEVSFHVPPQLVEGLHDNTDSVITFKDGGVYDKDPFVSNNSV